MQVGQDLFGSARFRIALVSVFTLVFVALWLWPGSDQLRQSESWFPVALHTVTEAFSIVVSVMVFAVSWHAYRPERPGNLMILACGFLATALLDFGHLMSYRDMPQFITGASPQKAISFWLCARIIGALTVLVIAFRAWNPFVNPGTRYWMVGTTLAVVAAVYYLLLWHESAWPRFFIDGQGLTPIKIAIETGVVVVLSVVALRLWRSKGIDPPYDVQGMLTATLLWIISELALMSYENVNDVFSLLGHLCKVLAFFFIYRLAFVASVREPYDRLAVEIEEKEAAELQVEALAFYDSLTGLPNKALLRDRATQTLAARHAGQGKAALLLINVDGFKHINDSFGHRFGDAVLHAIAERLPRCLDDADTVSRLGSDEFAVMLRNVADGEDAALVLERILLELGRPMHLFGQETHVTASIGVALSPADGASFEALFQNASIALHRAKEGGGNCWRFYDATMNHDVAERLQLRNGLRQALERGEFVLHYQPQFDLQSQALVGVEALVRWQPPNSDMVAPMRFIPEAEASGLIVPIGQWIVHEACRQTMAWRAAGIRVPRVAVNLSAVQFQRDNVVAMVLGALEKSGLPATDLELELTESILIQDAVQVLATVRQLRALGVRLSIDDFGTGYSSLAYLRDFPIDKLKVDQSFVREMGARDDGEVIVAAIIQLARSLGLETIAEGVEDQAAADALLRLGCNQAQGYLYAKPLSPDQLAGFLRARTATVA
ncbi:MAG: hypothetical protein A3E01_18395 [Gammaproteobacteria bacterium RIFCSPHIGHO2_12_FULL_63_22]|nr:MAG: hypothetical protein A3E01_18395 [Gammaproteobacteria bacterium RIFCSPHIGHO2_12_FULL_63_22]